MQTNVYTAATLRGRLKKYGITMKDAHDIVLYADHAEYVRERKEQASERRSNA